MSEESAHGSSVATSNRKRQLEGDGNLEDLVEQICTKLGDLTTKAPSTESQIEAFIEVLQCSDQEAIFFLESANYDISTAVSLFLEEQQFSKRRALYADETSGRINFSREFTPVVVPRYTPRLVIIEGLAPEWEATVSPRSGRVAFTHTPTGTRQYEVPPGFADLHSDGKRSAHSPDESAAMDTQVPAAATADSPWSTEAVRPGYRDDSDSV
jgi:hypothetical protein